MKQIILTIILLSIMLMSTIKPSKSVCCKYQITCGRKGFNSHYCEDCSESTPYCGLEKCNLFGCNCDGGCRRKQESGWCWKRDSGCHLRSFYNGIFDSENFFRSIDTDSDGKISLTEAKIYLQKNKPENTNIEEEFAKLDIDFDGFLSLKEIDSY